MGSVKTGGAPWQPSHKAWMAAQSEGKLRLQIRSIDGGVFWVDTQPDAPIVTIKQAIQETHGIDVIMQKLICMGRVLNDEATPAACSVTERDFLVLVTAKPRPPSLMTTGAPLPSSYSMGIHGGSEDDEEDMGEEGDEGR